MRSHAADNSASVLAVGLPERLRGQRGGALERATEGALLGVAELKRDLVQRAATPLQRVLGELDTLLLTDIEELHAHACQSPLPRHAGGAKFLGAAIDRTVPSHHQT